MKLLSFYQGEKIKLGVKTEKGILDVSGTLEKKPMKDIPESIDEILIEDRTPLLLLKEYIEVVGEEGVFLKEESLNFAPAVPRPNKIIGVGLNYWGYLRDSDTPTPDFPRLFSKFADAVNSHEGIIRIPDNASQVDYEGELAFVVGKKGRLIDPKDAMEYVLGYTITNDVTCRDFQDLTPSWFPGKSCDTFAPLGPYLVTADEIPNPNDLSLKAWVNGELRQDTNTSDMIVKIPEIISGVSKFLTICPGDVFLTGSPEGIIVCYPADEREALWLKEGDVLEVEIENLGRLVNHVKDEKNCVDLPDYNPEIFRV